MSARPRLTVARVEEALRRNGGVRLHTATALNVHRSTLHIFMQKHPRLWDVVAEVEESTVDLAEGVIIKAIANSDTHTARWYLERKGKARGYTTRHEHTGADGDPIQQSVIPGLDLSKLTDDELILFNELQDKASRGRS